MAVKIRLSRIGKKHVPFYRIIAVDSRKKRDGACLDNLGTYDALKGQVVHMHTDRIRDWVAKGAILSDTVKRIFKMHTRAAKA
jgi:small subunit ribosomal protein S16